MTVPTAPPGGHYDPYYGYMPPPPAVHPDEIRPKKSQYWFATAAIVLSFFFGVGLVIWSAIAYSDGSDSMARTLISLLGWAVITLGITLGKVWLILVAVKRGQHTRQLRMQRRAEQMGWIQTPAHHGSGWATQ